MRRVFASFSAPAADRAELRAFVMACAVLGVPLIPVNCFREKKRIIDGVEVRNVEWHLKQSDSSKVHKTNELWKWWNDPAWLEANKTHPLAVMREYWQALKDAEAHEKASFPYAVLRRGNKHAFIPTDPSFPAAKKNKLIEMLEK